MFCQVFLMLITMMMMMMMTITMMMMTSSPIFSLLFCVTNPPIGLKKFEILSYTLEVTNQRATFVYWNTT